MAKPTALPIWNTNETLAIVPDAAHQSDGWLAPGGVPEKPPLETFNYWMNNVYKWQKYFEDLTDSLLLVGRSQFAWVSTSSISITGGGYLHHGTTSQVLLINSTITHTITTPGTSQWMYFYLDDSAIVTAGSNIITGSQVINSATPPTYSVTKKGWYNGADLCIFAVYISSSGSAVGFSHNGDAVQFWTEGNSTGGGSIASGSHLTITVSVPSFSKRIIGLISISGGTNQGAVSYYTGGAGATSIKVGHYDGTTHQGAISDEYTVQLPLDSSNEVEILQSTGVSATMDLIPTAWFFPIGM